MKSGIISLIITLIINGIVSVVFFFGMIVAMNGFSERHAEWGIYGFIVIAGISGILTAILSFAVCSFSQNKWQLNSIIAAIISIIGFSVVNGIVNFIAIIISIAIAEAKRKGGI